MRQHADGRRPKHRRRRGAQLRRGRYVRLFLRPAAPAHNHLVNAAGRPFGDDWINFWSGSFLALHSRAAEIYDLNAFHAFQQTVVGPPLDGRLYAYPPVTMLLVVPFALILYVPALFV